MLTSFGVGVDNKFKKLAAQAKIRYTYRIRPMKQLAKCPNCQSTFRINEVKQYENDKGGWILECEECNAHSALFPIQNPQDWSSVKGAKIIYSWDEDIEKTNEAIEKYKESLIKEDSIDRILVIEEGKDERTKFKHAENHVYFCNNCGEEIESNIYQYLENNFDLIKKEYHSSYNYYLKDYHSSKYFMIVSQTKCDCGQDNDFICMTDYSGLGEFVEHPDEIILVDVQNSNISHHIDGIFEREACNGILEKLFLRWRYIHNAILIVVPFVGNQFQTPEERNELLNWLLKYLDPSKSILFTRKRTSNKFKKDNLAEGLDFDLLSEYDSLNPILENTLGREDFHAKFYAAISSSGVEMLVGSHNIHGGSYLENISFKKYLIGEFINKYLFPIGAFYKPPEVKYSEYFVDLRGDEIKNNLYKSENAVINNLAELYV